MSKNRAHIWRKGTVKLIRFIIKGIGIFAFFVMMSLPEAPFLQGKGFFEAMLLCLGAAVLCIVPMVLTGIVCAAEETEMKIRNK